MEIRLRLLSSPQQSSNSLDAQQVYLEDVSLGSALHDVWLTASGNNALPAKNAVFNLVYGNRSGALAAGMRLTSWSG